MAQVAKSCIRDDSGRVARLDPESPQDLCTRRLVSPAPGRSQSLVPFQDAGQRLSRRSAVKSVPRSSLRRSTAKTARLDPAPARAGYFSGPASGRMKQAQRRGASGAFGFEWPQHRALLRRVVRPDQSTAQGSATADDAGARVCGHRRPAIQNAASGDDRCASPSTLLKPGRHRADLSQNASGSTNVSRDLHLAPSGSPRSSKYSLVTLNTNGASRRSPMRFGTAISPLRVSDRFQTKSTLTLANESAAAIHSAR